VLNAGSGETALTLASQQPLSLITLGIMLPGMDGWSLLSRLKTTPALARVPVVIVSMAADEAKGVALGAAAFLQKPVSREYLVEALANLGLDSPPRDIAAKVLVVDDDADAVELIASRLLNAGNTVLRAYTGRDALDLALQHLPDLIVLDLLMPEMDGFQVVAALEAQTQTAFIPILIVTAKLITTEERIALSGRVATIIDKGEFALDNNRFATEIRRALSSRKQNLTCPKS
jgi:CheY-like chemotaxis protein